jgi:exodeoxyribonuclease-5
MDAVKAWDRRGVFRLFGYAGTGKTTLAKAFADQVGGTVKFAAFTGKAALVLQSKGCWSAGTIHSLIYLPSSKSTENLERLEEGLEEARAELEKAEGENVSIYTNVVTRLEYEVKEERDRVKSPHFSLNPDSDLRSADLLVVDEVSMVGEQIGTDLLTFDVPILVLGDPAQLPPVKGTGFFTKQEPDVLLTEIHRQAAGNPVLKLAHQIRRGEGLTIGEYGDSRVVPKGVLKLEDVVAFEQVIVGTNRCRRDLNRKIRDHKGYPAALPVAGDKLVCLRNNYDRGLLNGGQWEVVDVEEVDQDVVRLTITGDGFTQILTAWRHHFENREEELPLWSRRVHDEFDFGYAITAHKAQGSEWKDVLVIDESACFRAHRNRWLYTAVTRAAEKVTVVVQ